MQPLAQVIRTAGYFLRRRDLLSRGYSDKQIGAALAMREIFRVRHGWYSVPDAPQVAVRSIRVGGRLTGLSALESLGLPVPKPTRLDVAVPPTASRLRTPDDRRERLGALSDVTVHWDDVRDDSQDASGDHRRQELVADGNSWRVPASEALLVVLRTAPSVVAVACCGLALQRRLLSPRQMEAVFDLLPQFLQSWRSRVSGLDESHGETYFRLLLVTAKIPFEQQMHVKGIGRFDFRLTPCLFVEIDGAQHDPAWTGASPSSWADGLDRDAAMAATGARVLHFGYRQLYGDRQSILAAIERALADDAALAARRRQHPFVPRPISRPRS